MGVGGGAEKSKSVRGMENNKCDKGYSRSQTKGNCDEAPFYQTRLKRIYQYTKQVYVSPNCTKSYITQICIILNSYVLWQAILTQSGNTLSRTSTLNWGGWLKTRPCRLTPWNRTSNYCTGGWVGPSVSLDWCGKYRPYGGFTVARGYLSLSVVVKLSPVGRLGGFS